MPSLRPVRTRSRRRLDIGLLSLGGVVIAGGAAIGAFAGNTEHIQSYWSGAELRSDGTAAITEVIDYDFGSTLDKHGIYRDVKDLDPNARIEVSSPGAPDDLLITSAPADSPSFPATRLRIGNPDQTVSGAQRYVISYDLDTLIAGSAVAWNAIGPEWSVPIKHVTVELAAPFQLDGVVCQQGGAGSTSTCEISQPEPGHLVATPGSLDANEGITIRATVGAPLAAAPALSPPTGPIDPGNGTGLLPPAGVALAGALVGAFPASRWVRRRGRERVGVGGAADAAWATDSTSERLVDSDQLASLATIEFAPPNELSPAQGGVLLTEDVKPHHKVAWLITEAIAGTLAIDQTDGKRVELRRLGFGSPDAVPVLDAMFAGRDEITLGRYDKNFASGWSQLGSGLSRWMKTSGLWDPAGDRRRLVVRLVGIAAVLIGLLVTVGGAALAARSGPAWLIGVAAGALLAGIGLASAVRAWELRVRTPLGSGLWLRVESFRRFLAESEAYHAEQAAARGVLREYTAWAVAVGEIDRWTHAMASAADLPDRSALTYAYLYPVLVSSTASASTAPSSSGGGGGGGVGGGGGGGGGGSW